MISQPSPTNTSAFSNGISFGPPDFNQCKPTTCFHCAPALSPIRQKATWETGSYVIGGRSRNSLERIEICDSFGSKIVTNSTPRTPSEADRVRFERSPRPNRPQKRGRPFSRDTFRMFATTGKATPTYCPDQRTIIKTLE